MSVRVEFRWSEEFKARVDAAAGFEPRASFVRRAVELALNGYPITGGPTQETFDAVVAERDRLEDELRALRAVERALGDEQERDGGPAVGANSVEPERLASTPESAEHRPSPAPAEQPEMQGLRNFAESITQPVRRVSPSGPASPRVPFRRDVKPFQRGGGS